MSNRAPQSGAQSHATMSGAEYWGKTATVLGVILFVLTAAAGAAVPSANGAFRAAGVTVALVVLFVALPCWAYGRIRR